MTMSSLTISIEPLAIKYRDTMTSPWCTKVSPGGAWVVLNFIDRALESNNNFDIFHNLPLNVFRYNYLLSSKYNEYLPEATRRSTLECRTIIEQISVQMNAYVGLEAVWKAFQHHIHVNSICIRPSMLKYKRRFRN